MSETRPTEPLPDSEQALLKTLHEESLPLLRARVKLLRQAGWTLAQVGAPLGKNRSTTRMWEQAALDEHLQDAGLLMHVPYPSVKPAGQRVVRLYPDVPLDQRAELHEIATVARTVRGWMKPDDPARVAAQRLEEMLHQFVRMGVPYKRIADHMGVTHRAVAARLERAAERSHDRTKPYQVSIQEAAA